MVFLFWFIYLAAQRERRLSVAAQDWAQRPPALLTTLASVIYQERSSGDPHKAIRSHYWKTYLRHPILQNRDSPNQLPSWSALPFGRLAWEKKAF